MSKDTKLQALGYHRNDRPGKIEVVATKPLSNQHDLALAYSPGVAAACEEIVEHPDQVAELTARGNLVAVISDGTAVLGLGTIGPLAAKPVMEGKAVLFKKFAGIDVFDIEVSSRDVDHLCDVVAALEPTFGGINLEDIKAPECFDVEARLSEKMDIPVFHDDQHGTAIIVAAAVTNAMILTKKSLSDVKVVTSGAGAAAIACLNLLVSLGVSRGNIWVSDIDGVVYKGRDETMNRWMAAYAQDTDKRSLGEIINGADIFLGLSAGNVLKPDMVKRMAPRPLIMALANPTPEIMPKEARAVNPEAMICTGRSDYPNQVNNVLCFPYIFRGALDTGATMINEEMKLAAVKAIAELTHEASSEIAEQAYGGAVRLFGPDYLIPTPFDPRLILRIAPAVARAAMESGVARRPIKDFTAYNERLTRFVFRSGFVMKPVFTRARLKPKWVIYAEGEDERILRAAQTLVEENTAKPILIARPRVIDMRLKRYGLSIRPGRDFEIIDPNDDPRYRQYVESYLERTDRRGVTTDLARTIVRTNTTVIAALAVYRGEADAMICGLEGRFDRHLSDIRDVIGLTPDADNFAALSLIIVASGVYFLADTYVQPNPSAEEIAKMTRLAAEQVRAFGLEPKVALLSHSSFGSADTETAIKMREVLDILRKDAPGLEVEGEMHGDAAIDETLRTRIFPRSALKGRANMLIMPTLDAANISYQLIKSMANAQPIGPILLGPARPAHILTPSVTVRGVINMTALSVVEAQRLHENCQNRGPVRR